MKHRRRYRKWLVRTWADERFLNLSPPRPSGQWLFVYLKLGPHTTSIPGLSAAGEASLAERLKWPLPAFRRCLDEIKACDLVKVDWRAGVVWLPGALEENEPESPNVVKSWRHSWDEIPACALKDEAARTIRHYLEGFNEAFLKALPDGFGEAPYQGLPKGIAEAFAKGTPAPFLESGTGAGTRTRAGTGLIDRTIPILDPGSTKKKQRLRRHFDPPDDAEKNLSVITVLVHKLLDAQTFDTEGDLVEEVSKRCARDQIVYSPAVIGRAIDSAAVQRQRAGKA